MENFSISCKCQHLMLRRHCTTTTATCRHYYCVPETRTRGRSTHRPMTIIVAPCAGECCQKGLCLRITMALTSRSAPLRPFWQTLALAGKQLRLSPQLQHRIASSCAGYAPSPPFSDSCRGATVRFVISVALMHCPRMAWCRIPSAHLAEHLLGEAVC